MNKVLAIDMGATSIRGILGYIKDGELRLDEVMRINHKIVDVEGRKHWEWDKIISTIEDTILTYQKEIVSIGVDTWGVDFGLLNENEELIQPPLSYRDERHHVGYDLVASQMDLYTLYSQTGNQIMAINSLFQLVTIKELQPEVLKEARHLLMTPDLVTFYLTGVLSGEKTICSTSQMFNLSRGRWNRGIIESFGLNYEIFPQTINNKMIVGSTKNAVLEKLRNTDINVVSVASHDTASAVAITQAYDDPEVLFLSSGTWSLLGCYTDRPVLTKEAYDFDLTNETGYNGRNMFFQNITGLYLIEKLNDEFERLSGRSFSYPEITEIVSESRPFQGFIDVYEPVFGQETDSIISDIEAYFDKTGQQKLEDPKGYFRVIYESMVLNYATLVDYLEKVTHRQFKKIHVIGGGSQSAMLCQMIADGLNLTVVAGPSEATAIGNILAQLEAVSSDYSATSLRDAIDKTNKLVEYKPTAFEEWAEAKNSFRRGK